MEVTAPHAWTADCCFEFQRTAFLQKAFYQFLKNLYANLTSREIILFDGAEQMNTLRWLLFSWRLRHAGGLIITMHRPGRLPTLWECVTSPRLLADIAARLLDVEVEIIQERAHELYWKHRGNLRESLRAWYDLLAMMPDLPPSRVNAPIAVRAIPVELV